MQTPLQPTSRWRGLKRNAWILAAMIGAANAQSQPAPTNTRATASIEQLKAYYLACDAIMSTRRVDAALAQRCASIGQQVQERAFGGDFDEMIAWWQREREAARAARPKDAA